MFGPRRENSLGRNSLNENVASISKGEELEKKNPEEIVEIILMPRKTDFRCFSFWEANTSINSQKRSVCEMTVLDWKCNLKVQGEILIS